MKRLLFLLFIPLILNAQVFYNRGSVINTVQTHAFEQFSADSISGVEKITAAIILPTVLQHPYAAADTLHITENAGVVSSSMMRIMAQGAAAADTLAILTGGSDGYRLLFHGTNGDAITILESAISGGFMIGAASRILSDSYDIIEFVFIDSLWVETNFVDNH